MAELEERVRDTTDALDALGNTTAATGKGFAIGSAVLTSLSLLSAFKKNAGVQDVDLSNAYVMSGILFGAMLPFLFAALTMLSVQKAAGAIIIEVRRQFAEIEGLREGTAEPDCDKCVAISTQSSVEEMILPGLYAIMSPLIIGLLIGPRALAGMLAGAIASGMMLAIMMSNAGGAWGKFFRLLSFDLKTSSYNVCLCCVLIIIIRYFIQITPRNTLKSKESAEVKELLPTKHALSVIQWEIHLRIPQDLRLTF